ncbi:SDR family NAD(P)-dependent oxidoreductase [Plantactinospora endophytica]|uniref:3-oxoacyl-ACP reductase n=1 Tax=Plantactinospora endophytica TaxID=673535 RepID=A0ABQ4DW44_9ACTN|nr:glucose 1-dehydrogenase [Plantactinospora endophytica]GIG86680.1 3-oxoacyl-ACP reductase [Plantactinospora endophytica]
MSDRELSGRVALVTGGTGGIGATIARVLSEAGAAVTVVGRRAELGTAVAAELADGLFVPADLSRRESHHEVLQSTVDRFGGLDILVNNAAAHTAGLTHESTEEEFDRVVGLNYKATYFLTQAALPHLLSGGGGRIVNISSIGTTRSWAGASIYNSSKAALDNLTRTWAVEYGPQGLRVNGVNPGIVADGPMSYPVQAAFDIEEDILPTIPARRLATAADVAAATLFLAGPGADYLSGVTIALDGGLTA